VIEDENLPHGERWVYLRGCRCAPCKRASSEYQRQWRQNQLADQFHYPPRERGGAWRAKAACLGLNDLFFVRSGESIQPALAICNACEVQTECRQYAIDAREKFGIWGGIGERARRRMKREGSAA
jgi:putative component of membrane protein insertase Oxa1/YidC/SpoIIIJ protein YidD